jgi:hypothetical protein
LQKKKKKWNMCRYWWKIRNWGAVHAGTSAILDRNKQSWVMQYWSGHEEWTSTGQNSCTDWSQKCLNTEAVELAQYARRQCITEVKVSLMFCLWGPEHFFFFFFVIFIMSWVAE